MKVYVVGNCQSGSLAACLSVMLPHLDIEHPPFGRDVASYATDDDVVVRHRTPNVPWSMREPRSNEILCPLIWFNAFHPDCVYTEVPDRPHLLPMGMNSSLVLYAWHRRMTVAQTAKLFCEPVFEKLNFFGYWAPAKRALLEDAERIGFPLDALFSRWERLGVFMHFMNHPALTVMADIARTVAQRAGMAVEVETPEQYLADPLLHLGVWPVYPEIASRLGLSGSYAFRPAQPPSWSATPTLLDLEQFIVQSFEAYARVPEDALRCSRLESAAYRDLGSVIAGGRRGSRRNGAVAADPPVEPHGPQRSPYAGLPPQQFWRASVASVPPYEVDPTGPPPFAIDRSSRIATAGSCFAQHVSRAVGRYGYTYHVTEPAPAALASDDDARSAYEMFSARFGNIYTARQLLQLFDRAYGALVPQEQAWLRSDGRFADPFRPHIDPGGFATVDELLASRALHLAAVRAMFEELDVFVFTLGLTEGWEALHDGAVFPLAPGVAAGAMDDTKFAFRNFTAAEVTHDVQAFLQRLRAVNSSAKVILTVSPVPLIATFEPRHVLVSTTYSKSVLRVAAGELERSNDNVWYFPSYEIVTGAFNRGRYFAPDLRSVTPDGVQHVLRLFFGRCAGGEVVSSPFDAMVLAENRANAAIVCDEEAIVFDAAQEAASTIGSAQSAAAAAEYERQLALDQRHAVAPSERTEDVHSMEALEPSSMRAPIAAVLPSAVDVRTVVTVNGTVTNDGPASLVSGGEHPIFLCYRWYDEAGNLTEVGNSLHTPLPAPLGPGASFAFAMSIRTPQFEGRYRLRVALLQSNVAWFDDVDFDNGVDGVVEVTRQRVRS